MKKHKGNWGVTPTDDKFVPIDYEKEKDRFEKFRKELFETYATNKDTFLTQGTCTAFEDYIEYTMADGKKLKVCYDPPFKID